jgi:hypothetical protein
VTDLSYDFRKSWRRILLARPSPFVVAFLAVGFSIFILGGGIYDLLEKPLALLPLQGRWIFYYPSDLNAQFLNESLFIMILYGVGVVGSILIYQSTKYEYRPKQAYMTLMLGFVFVFLAFLALEFALGLKFSGSYY